MILLKNDATKNNVKFYIPADGPHRVIIPVV